MKPLILVAVILQLLVTITESYKFGDIIAFTRTCRDNKVYTHYAIWVGPKSENDVGQGDNDIFHLSGQKCAVSACKFGKLADVRGTSKDKLDNYMDVPGFKPSLESMMNRIKERNGKCQMYGPRNANCEHVSTYVRYGESVSNQHDTLAGKAFKGVDAAAKAVTAVLKQMDVESTCPFSGDLAG